MVCSWPSARRRTIRSLPNCRPRPPPPWTWLAGAAPPPRRPPALPPLPPPLAPPRARGGCRVLVPGPGGRVVVAVRQVLLSAGREVADDQVALALDGADGVGEVLAVARQQLVAQRAPGVVVVVGEGALGRRWRRGLV